MINIALYYRFIPSQKPQIRLDLDGNFLLAHGDGRYPTVRTIVMPAEALKGARSLHRQFSWYWHMNHPILIY